MRLQMIKRISFVFLLFSFINLFSFAENIKLDRNSYKTGSLGVIFIDKPNLDSVYKAVIIDPETQKKYKFFSYGNEILFGIHRDFKGKFAVIKIYRDDKLISEKKIPIQQKFYRVSKIWIKNRKKVEPDKKILERIKRENKLIRSTLRVFTDRYFKESRFHKPLKKISISTPFGARRIINNKIKYTHSGTDFRAKWGTPVRAVLSGRVVIARDFYLTGKTIIINHGLGLYSLYAHLSKMKVKEGQFVKAGQIIGNVGSTGRSTGPHLHLGVYINGMRVDPIEAFKTKLKVIRK
jgi:murein DD-endopeptidase MepM/ murein hydrolase activator NlpD